MGRILDQDDGLGVYAGNLLNHLFTLDQDSRYIVLLRTPRHVGAFKDFDNVEVEVIPARIKLLWDQVSVPLAARRYNADVIFNPKFSLPLLTKRAGVFVLHGSDWYVNPGNYEWWDNLYIRAMMPVYCRKARRLLAISQTIVDDLVKYAHVDPHKVTVSHAAPSEHFNPNPDKEELNIFSRRYCLPERFIFSVARAYHSGHGKQPPYTGGNIDTLIASYRMYRKKGGRHPLVIAGDRIREYLLSRGMDESLLRDVHFTGFIKHNEINLAYNLAEFFVLLTLYESFSLPLVEAMASGCPVIVSCTGACPEVSGGAACLVDPHDTEGISQAMLDMEKSSDMKQSLRKAGIERAGMFTWEHTAKLTMETLHEAADQSP